MYRVCGRILLADGGLDEGDYRVDKGEEQFLAPKEIRDEGGKVHLQALYVKERYI